MKYYLSSFRVGDRPADLVKLAANRPLALIPNALDGFEREARQLSNARALDEVRTLGIDIDVVDLQAWFGRNDLARRLEDFGGVWVRGGNTFVLRRAMHLSSLDRVLRELRASDFLYGGYSAGVCVLAPDLRGLQQVDDPHVAPYPDCPVIWEGLGFLDSWSCRTTSPIITSRLRSTWRSTTAPGTAFPSARCGTGRSSSPRTRRASPDWCAFPCAWTMRPCLWRSP